MTTTDGVSVDERLVVGGDYTGPAGAARVLRDVSVDAAVLETARGGILRRGLAVRSADVALLTNVSDDHIGHYGIDDLGVLARVKSVVGRVVPASGRVVVNADDPHLMAEAASFEAPLVLFSASGGARLAAPVAQGGEAWTLAGDQIVRMRSGTTTTVVAVRDVPLTFGGAALYNVANALGAAACASALGVSDEVIRRGLASFASSAEDNPGRGNLVERHGVRVLVDFAHNPDGIRNVLSLVAKLRGDGPGRLALVAGYAGDRSNASVEDAARAMFDAAPSRVFLRDLAGYLRGRAPGEVPARMMGALERLGLSKEAMQVAPNETEAVARALDWATPGDFVVVLAHLETAGVFELLGS
jgi:UDP-N-acetylmuramyl tripeptide synthase